MGTQAIPGDDPHGEGPRSRHFEEEALREQSAGRQGMPPEGKLDPTAFSADTVEFMRLLGRHEVEYVIVGGEAVIFHGYPRFTGDVDFLFGQDRRNAVRLFRCLEEFWTGDVPEVTSPEDLLLDGVVIQFGRPPNRIDLHNRIDGIGFSDAYDSRVVATIEVDNEVIEVPYIGIEPLKANKAASGRPKDLDDIEHLP